MALIEKLKLLSLSFSVPFFSPFSTTLVPSCQLSLIPFQYSVIFCLCAHFFPHKSPFTLLCLHIPHLPSLPHDVMFFPTTPLSFSPLFSVYDIGKFSPCHFKDGTGRELLMNAAWGTGLVHALQHGGVGGDLVHGEHC